MQSHIISNRRKPKTKTKWLKVRSATGLYRYEPSGVYFANVRKSGKLHRESLKTTDLEFARRKLHDFKQRLQRTDPRYNRISLVEWLQEHYFKTLTNSPGALAAKQRIIAKVKKHWFAATAQPLRDIRQSHVLKFLSEQYGPWGHSYWNSALTFTSCRFRDGRRRPGADGESLHWTPMEKTQTTDSGDTIIRRIQSNRYRHSRAEVQWARGRAFG